MKEVQFVEENHFKEMFLEELKNNFSESEMQQLLIDLPKEKSKLVLMINRKRQDAI